MDVFVPIHFAESATEDCEPCVVYAVEMRVPDFVVTEGMFPVDVVEFRNCMHVACLLHRGAGATEGTTPAELPTDDPRVVFMHYASRFPPTLESRMWLWREVVQLFSLTRPVSMQTLPAWGHVLHLHTMAMDSKQLTFVQELQLMQTAIGIMVQHTCFVDNTGPLLSAINQHPKAHRSRAVHKVTEELREASKKAAGEGAPREVHDSRIICHEGYLFDLNIEARVAKYKTMTSRAPETLSWLVHGIFLALTLSPSVSRYQELIQHAVAVSLQMALVTDTQAAGWVSHKEDFSHYEANAQLVEESAAHVKECCAAVAGDMRLANRVDVPVAPGSGLWVCLADNFDHNPIAHTFAGLFLELEARQLVSLTSRASLAVAFIKGLVAQNPPSTGVANPRVLQPQGLAKHYASSNLEAALKLPPIKPNAARLRYAYQFPTMGTRRMATFVDSEKEAHTLPGGFSPCDPLKIMTQLPCLGSDPLIALDSIAHFSSVMTRHTSSFGLDGHAHERLRLAARLAFFGITHAYSMISANKEVPMLHATMRLSGTLEGMVLGLAHHLTQSELNYRKGHLGNIGNPATRKFLAAPAAAKPAAVPCKSPPFWKSLGHSKRQAGAASSLAQPAASSLARRPDQSAHPVLIINEDDEAQESEPTRTPLAPRETNAGAQPTPTHDLLDAVLEVIETRRLNARDPRIMQWLNSRGYADRVAKIAQQLSSSGRSVVQLIDGPVESDFIFLEDGTRFQMFDGMYTALSSLFDSMATVIFAPGLPYSKSTTFIDSRLKNVRGLLRRREPSGFVVPVICALTEDETKVHAALRILFSNNVPHIRKSDLVINGKLTLPIMLPDTLDFRVTAPRPPTPEQWICGAFERELQGLGLEPRAWAPPAKSNSALQFVHDPPTNIFPLSPGKIYPLAESIMTRSAVINYTVRVTKLSQIVANTHPVVVSAHHNSYFLVPAARTTTLVQLDEGCLLLWHTIKMHLQNREV